ncbi:single-stranded-DNA-specific exonuclease RecJ [Telmatocola sphagniphila]|uniref:Single-stranded-DNA-specific exonuclease RecJ n=1 Tax=Telmatocola sphagniphila TaxID=1123043 RepID=A0A8E6EXB4_9BACT|nr:single-stranded-DNA-specific exonuclease RecJ [Telmatocola sphagniphila]
MWHLHQFDAEKVQFLAREANVPAVVAQILFNRGVRQPAEVRRFLDAPLNGLHAPESLPGVPEAVELLYETIEKKHKICIYGDYDVDGVTGTSILYRLLTILKTPVQFHVPHRLEEGYGLNEGALQKIAEDGCKLVVTVDCGIASIQEAETARKLGLKLIITDHHEMKSVLPSADVLVHPRLPDTHYPFDGLSGAGVAFKLAWALAKKVSGGERVSAELREFLLDAVLLATLGLIADVVPLLDENRILVKHGLIRMKDKPFLGLKALIDSANKDKEPNFKAEEVAFKLAPRMNAAGRLGCARLVVEMLTTDVPIKAHEVAAFLESQNHQRQTLEKKITQHAKEMLAEVDLAHFPAAVLAHAEWHPGVIGIVASRIVEHIGRPSLMIAIKEGQPLATGSGRSIPGFELHKALKACEVDLVAHGGHAMAVGLKIEPKKIEDFRKRFTDYAGEHFPQGVPPAPRLNIDAEVPLSSLTPQLLRDLDKLEPFGSQNSKPRFLAGGIKIVGEPKKMGQTGTHLNLFVQQGNTKMRAVGWGMADRIEELMSAGGDCCLVFEPKINTWNGMSKIELEIRDLRPGANVELS